MLALQQPRLLAAPAQTTKKPRRRKTWRPGLEILECRLAPSATYFVSPSGHDAYDGLSPATPWRTLDRATAQQIRPGDSILLEGGATHAGTLTVGGYGDPNNPMTIGSYGFGRATIASGDGRALYACTGGGLQIQDLILQGPGADATDFPGLEICNYGTWTGPARGFHIDNVDVSGYGLGGIVIFSDDYGIDDIRITRVSAHHNANGIMVGNAIEDQRAITNLYIGNVQAYHNNRSFGPLGGVGIGLANVLGGVVEHSLMYENGPLSAAAGRAGLWVYYSTSLVVQYNEVYGNDDPDGLDGQGMVFVDCQFLLVQYNYSHNNLLSGIQVTAHRPERPSWDVTIRYNVSEDDYGGIMISGPVWNVEVYNNTVFATNHPDYPRTGFVVSGWDGGYLNVRNNIFYNRGGLVVAVDDLSLVLGYSLQFQNNVYFTENTTFPLLMQYGQSVYFYLDHWRNETGQEVLYGIPVGSTEDPQLVNPGGGGTVGDPNRIGYLDAYQLRPESPFRFAGLDMRAWFEVDPGLHDFNGNPLNPDRGFSIGSHHATGGFAPGLPAAGGDSFGGLLPEPNSLAELAGLADALTPRRSFANVAFGF